jgi:hypothetical protein
MKFPGFIGPSYNLPSVNVDCQRAVNIYAETIESGTGKEGSVAYFDATPGLEKILNVGDGPIRFIIRVPTPWVDYPDFPKIVYMIVSGDKVYSAIYSLTLSTWTVAVVPDVPGGSTPMVLDTATGPIRGKSKTGLTIIPANPPSIPSDIPIPYGMVYFADGQKLYTFGIQQVGGAGPIQTSCSSVIGPIASFVEAVDGFFIINQVDSGMFYVSDWGSLNFDPLSYASAEGDPDNIVAILVKDRELWLFNERTTEVWANTGNADFPFERIQGGFIEKGCSAPYSVAKIDGIAFWLGRDESGEGVVYAAQGASPQRVSTHAIERDIRTYADISSASAYTYSENGHSFYVINFAEKTWVYDLKTQMWHERAYTNAGALERHRSEVHAYFPELKLHLVGDYANNKIYALKDGVYTDDLETITRMRVTPHVSAGLKRVFYNSLTLDMETGVGLDGSVQGSDPQVMLQFSNDGGHTWSNEDWVSAGKKIGGIGDFKKRVIWNRLGSARDRVFKIVITDPVPIRIIGAELDFEVGKS